MTKFAIKFKDIHPKSRVKLKDKECTYVIVTAATQGESWIAEELGNREKTSIIYTKDIIFVNNDHTDNPLDKHGSSILDTSIDSLDQETFKDLEKEIENLSTEAEQLILHEKFENFVTDNSEELLKDSNEKLNPISAKEAFKKKDKSSKEDSIIKVESFQEMVYRKAEERVQKEKEKEKRKLDLTKSILSAGDSIKGNLELDDESKVLIKALLDIAVTSLKKKIDNS